jgi:4-diphosphocytidyl-2-C-methyl-D-erythritol kinase
MVVFPPCKINLGLHVLSRRPDGYHEIVTFFYQVPWTDVLEVLPSDELSFSQTGDRIPGNPADNICVKAYHLLAKEFALPPVQMHLHKILPVGAGLGSGSSDCAQTLRVLSSLFNLQLTDKKLMEYATLLGSDCSFFIQDQPMLGKGRGELLTPLQVRLNGFYCVIVKPPVHVSTAIAYQGISPRVPEVPLEEVLTRPIRYWKDELKNDFEASVFQRHPEIQSIKEEMYSRGAVYASMSGSGSAVFGIFEKEIRWENSITDAVSWAGWL